MGLRTLVPIFLWLFVIVSDVNGLDTMVESRMDIADSLPFSDTVLSRSQPQTTQCDCNYGTCICSEEYGILTYISTYGAALTFKFVTGSPEGNLVMIMVNQSDIQFTDKSCTLQIGTIVIDQIANLEDTNYYYIGNNESVIIDGTTSVCNITIYYADVPPSETYTTIPSNQPDGVIYGPATDISQPDYPFQTRMKWSFSFPDNYVVQFNISYMDLGYRCGSLHTNMDSKLYNSVQNDMILIGIEENEIVQGSSFLFYGTTNVSKLVQVNSPNPFVIFYGTYHENDPTGFVMEYHATEIVIPSTPAPVITTTEPYFGEAPQATAAVNHALNKKNPTAMVINFQKAIANMATQYISIAGISVEDPQTVTPDEVMITAVQDCDLTVCTEDCVAFVFWIDKYNANKTGWAFTQDDLYSMLELASSQPYWSSISNDASYCDENTEVNWWLLGGVSVAIVIFAIIVSLLVCKISQAKEEIEDKEVVIQVNKEEVLERRRRSSGDASMIGTKKGGTRISLPFTKMRGSVASSVSSHFDQDFDTTDFVDYDTDFGYEDFGITNDVLPPPITPNFYTNAAFQHDSSAPSLELDDGLPRIGFVEPPNTIKHEPNFSGIPMKSAMKKPDSAMAGPSSMATKMATFDALEEEEYSSDADSDGALEFTRSPRLSVEADVHHESAL